MLFGWIGDKLRRPHALLLSGLLTLLVATSFLSFGRQFSILVTGRFLQGFSAALVWTSGLALLTNAFGQGRYGEAVGYTQTSTSIGTTAAPLLGGVVYAQGGYSAVCAMSMATVAVSVVLAMVMIEPKSPSRWEDSGCSTRVGSSAGRGGPEPGPEEEEEGRDPDADVERTAGERKASPRPVDERSALISKDADTRPEVYRPAYFLLLRSGRILTAMWGIFSFACVIISFEAMIPLFVKQTFQWDSRRAALVFLSWIVPGFLGPIAGKVTDRYKSPWIPVGGFLFMAPPLILMRFVTENSDVHKGLLIVLLTLVGSYSFLLSFLKQICYQIHETSGLMKSSGRSGFGLVWIIPFCVSDLSFTAANLKLDRPHEFGNSDGLALAFGLYVFSYSCGFLVGPTVAGVIKAEASWGAATLTLALACMVACVPFVLLIRSLSQ